ncbi:putative F-box domain-containing protein [Medicago truncatula]|uniref:F-box protein interaction domain protein n=1 Tax=Medicago truncatula TaxID=3880 RepID=G7IMV0_MEDTR|nr:putative F-box protein At3g16210 [Medicago truncatula]AES65045.1 F-box protein interaction domain protein [Medicago truncatula]RHN73089.1 putative F-box domain-containing protein [Medicago truncatula]
MSPPTFEKVSGTYIPDDIVFSILSKLPIKHLKRFACVRKSWSHLFENPIFMNMFRNNLVSKSQTGYDDDDACLICHWVLDPVKKLSFLTGEKFEKEIKLDLPPQVQIQQNDFLDYISILCSAINGILCIYNWFDPSQIVLWNPTTNEVHVVPSNLPESLPNVFVDQFLYGFGYDHDSDDYKVIRVVRFREDMFKTHDPFYEIYSLRSHSWRKLDVDIPIVFYGPLSSEVYLDGVCHWLRRINDKTDVVSFNLSNEVFFTTPLDIHGDVCLVVLNGSVAIISYYKGSRYFSISILGEIGVKESWTRLFDVGPLSSNLYPIAVGKKGNIFFKKKYDKSKLVCFDLTTGVVDDIDVKGKGGICDIKIYKKNLRRLKE